ncbi:MAG: hypothetical protein R3B96_22940 [Pirellulaceae bacterium]
MPHWYEHNGLRFAYPENWQIEEIDVVGQPLDITLQTPGGGLWSLQSIPGGMSPGEAAAQALKGSRGGVSGSRERVGSVGAGRTTLARL